MRLLVVDDHEAVRKGVFAILSSRDNIEVCGEATNGKEAIEKARELRPDLIILDITMPILDGISAARAIKTFLPEVPILLFSMHDSAYLVQEAKLVGVQGLLNKAQAGTMLLHAVDALLKQQTFFPDQAAFAQST